jgi:predicted nucleic acid-binding Zn ribbon protein
MHAGVVVAGKKPHGDAAGAHCERLMVSRPELSELGNTFCSDRCQRAYHRQLRNDKSAEELENVCTVCGKEFTVTRRDAKTCSEGCKQKVYRRRKREVQQNR